jgi:hypothetical protein
MILLTFADSTAEECTFEMNRIFTNNYYYYYYRRSTDRG